MILQENIGKNNEQNLPAQTVMIYQNMRESNNIDTAIWNRLTFEGRKRLWKEKQETFHLIKEVVISSCTCLRDGG